MSSQIKIISPKDFKLTPHCSLTEFIVTFDQYFDKTQQIELLRTILGSPTLGWRYIERDNPGALLPSDFALLRVRN